MQLIGLILLIATSWYIWKLSSNFLDEQTKKEINDNYEIFIKQLNDLKKRFSKEKLNELWENYKLEANSNNNNNNNVEKKKINNDD
tara:strand:+ start:1953 stop:2210 length:258 start_codon:yes stop_codon:yes gene_type:complete